MAQEIAAATGLSSSLNGWLRRIETEQPGSRPSIPSAVRNEAEAALSAIDEALKPAPEALVLRWLTALGTLTATRPDEADASGKVRAYAAMLELPASAFTRRSLDAAARRFRFFPSYAELTEHLEAETADARRTRHQLRRLAALPVADSSPAGQRWSELTAEQREQFEMLMAPFRRPRGEASPEEWTAGPEIRSPISETGPTL